MSQHTISPEISFTPISSKSIIWYDWVKENKKEKDKKDRSANFFMAADCGDNFNAKMNH